MLKGLATWARRLGLWGSAKERALAIGHVNSTSVGEARSEAAQARNWTYVAIHTIAKQWAAAELLVYGSRAKEDDAELLTRSLGSREDDEKKKHDPKHPISKLLRRPNVAMGFAQWMYSVAFQLHLHGTATIWEVRNESGEPIELWVVPRTWLTFQSPTADHPNGWYRISPADSWAYFGSFAARELNLDASELIHVNWPHPVRPGEGLSAVTACSRLVDVGEQTEHAVLASILNSPRPGLLLTADPNVALSESKIREIEQRLRESYSGPSFAGRILLLQGIKHEIIGTTFQDLSGDFRDANRRFLLNLHGVPAIATGASDDTSYSSGAASLNAFIELTIRPSLDLLADCLTARWSPIYGEEFRVEFRPRRYDDPTFDLQRAQAIFQLAASGYATPNEARAAFGLPPIPGGDEIREPQQPDPTAGATGQPGLDILSEILANQPPTETETGTRLPPERNVSQPQ